VITETVPDPRGGKGRDVARVPTHHELPKDFSAQVGLGSAEDGGKKERRGPGGEIPYLGH
jgi:hypothetical protein